MKIWIRFNLSLTLLLATSISTSLGDDWPQWRGGDFKSVSDESGIPTEFNKSKNIVFRIPLPGPAGSSPIVHGTNLFLTSVKDDRLVLMCFSTAGELRWESEFKKLNKNSRDGGNSASPSPCTDGVYVWAMMGTGELACYTVDGDLIWRKDLQKEYGKFDIQFGMTTTPVLDNGNLYIQLMHGNMRNSKPSIGQVIALDATSGNEIWEVTRETDGTHENKHSYASPVIYRDGSQEMLITHGADYVISHSLENGQELWRCGGFNLKGPSYNRFLRLVSSPACGDNLIVVPTAKRGPVLGLKPGLKGDVTLKEDAYHWKLAKGTPDVATPVIYDGFVYLAGENGDLTILDSATGRLTYRERLTADKQRATPVAVDGKVYIAGRRGVVVVIESGPDGKILAKNDLGEEITASPAVAEGRIYIRSFDALYAFGKK
ncbi:MAG: PQQ-binding-like beta-propeller repeat protein [Planctomycetota bacterium]